MSNFQKNLKTTLPWKQSVNEKIFEFNGKYKGGRNSWKTKIRRKYKLEIQRLECCEKKPKSQLTINSETTLALFIQQLSAHVLGYASGYFAFGKTTKHV